MKTSCINHPLNEPLIIISKWQSEICNGDIPAALIIGYFQLLEIRCLPRPNFIDTATMTKNLLDSWHKQTVSQGLKHLVELSLLTEYRFTASEAVGMCCDKAPQVFHDGDHHCEWCDCRTTILQQHHYPIPKSQQGELTVDICASCHAEFHYLTQTSFYAPTTSLLREFAKHPIKLEEVA